MSTTVHRNKAEGDFGTQSAASPERFGRSAVIRISPEQFRNQRYASHNRNAFMARRGAGIVSATIEIVTAGIAEKTSKKASGGSNPTRGLVASGS